MVKQRKGFTLVELIIVIVIVGILSIVAVPVYKGYTKKAMATEAKALLGAILTAEKIYFVEHGNFKVLDHTNYDKDLDVDSRGNKYFTSWNASLIWNTSSIPSTGKVGPADRVLFTTTGNQGSGADLISMAMLYSGTGTPTLFEAYEPGGGESLVSILSGE